MDLNKLQQTEAIFQKLPSFFQEHCRRTGKLAGGFLEYLMKEQAVSGMSDPGGFLDVYKRQCLIIFYLTGMKRRGWPAVHSAPQNPASLPSILINTRRSVFR